jgi:hypothetical protein
MVSVKTQSTINSYHYYWLSIYWHIGILGHWHIEFCFPGLKLGIKGGKPKPGIRILIYMLITFCMKDIKSVVYSIFLSYGINVTV